ncbi:MAG: hypothetical protein FWF85_04600 [Clostridiales bacterium]|jgi:hypothetical protein|nr:hypothetical protein [Clostridiales bacterium]
MLRKVLLISLLSLIASGMGIWNYNSPPLFAHEIITITSKDKLLKSDWSVITLYSNRLTIYKESKRWLAIKSKISKDGYAEILAQASSLPHDGHLESVKTVTPKFLNYVYSLQIGGKTYYTSLGNRDESLDQLILLVYRYVFAPSLETLSKLKLNMTYSEVTGVMKDGFEFINYSTSEYAIIYTLKDGSKVTISFWDEGEDGIIQEVFLTTVDGIKSAYPLKSF